jgi:uncharacterized protein affecting Mg2+/Co2+ transport
MGASTSGPDPTATGDQSAAGQISYNRFGACGSRIAMQPDTSLPLLLTASLPTTPLRASDKPSYTEIDMSVRNLSDSTVQVMTYRRGARLAITKDGTVIADSGGIRPAGTHYTIQPGEAHAYKSTLNLAACNADSGLAPGHFQIHALQTFTFVDDDLNRAPEILVYGGPWDLEIA